MRFAPKTVFSKFLIFLSLFSGHLGEYVTNCEQCFQIVSLVARQDRAIAKISMISFFICCPYLTLRIPRIFTTFTLFLSGFVFIIPNQYCIGPKHVLNIVLLVLLEKLKGFGSSVFVR